MSVSKTEETAALCADIFFDHGRLCVENVLGRTKPSQANNGKHNEASILNDKLL